MIYIFIFIAAALILITAFMYIRTSIILKRIDEMIDSAIDDSFSEKYFNEQKLSKLETKMHRYLAAKKISRDKINSEHNAIKTLVSDISHQTKTPISNILLYTQLLKESHTLEDNDLSLLSQIEAQTQKLSFLIQSLIKTSRLENGIVALSPKENSVRHLIENSDFSSAADKKNIKFIINDIPDITAFFDMKWTIEAISNIIDNAIKYTPHGGTVTISAAQYEMFTRIDIADSGIGISEEEISKIFRRFYRSPNVSDKKGAGIGLYLSREILSKENGYIKVSSELGKGSVFSVFLSNLSKL